MALTLYHNDMSVCAQKVRVVLAEKRIAHESRNLNLRQGESKTPAYMKINPKGVVPALVHDGRVVTESTVINEYVDEVFPAVPMKPDDPVERAAMRRLTRDIEAFVYEATGVVSASIAFHHQYSPEAIEARTRANPAWRAGFERLRLGVDNPAFPDAIGRLDAMLAHLDATLAESGGPWLLGERFTLADAGYAGYVTRLDHLQFGGMIARRPHLAAWYARLRDRPCYREAITAWLNPDYLALMEEKGRAAWPRVEALLAAAA